MEWWGPWSGGGCGGEEVGKEEDGEADGLNESGHPFARAAIIEVETTQENSDGLAREEEKDVQAHHPPPSPSPIFVVAERRNHEDRSVGEDEQRAGNGAIGREESSLNDEGGSFLVGCGCRWRKVAD